VALPTASDNKFPKVILEERLSDGSDTTTPAADHRALFLGEDGALHLKDSAAAVTDVGSGSSGGQTVECELRHSTTQSIATATDTAALFDTEISDDGAMHSGTTAPTASRIVVGASQDGKVLRVLFRITIPATATQWQAWVARNGTELGRRVRLWGTTSATQTLIVEYTARAADHVATDYYECIVRQNSGGALNIGSATADANNWAQAVSG
jgi:hypothetical protein